MIEPSEPFVKSSRAQTSEDSETLIVGEPYTKSRRAQSDTDHETWVQGQVSPTLNSFDMGDTRTTTAIVEQPMLIDGRRHAVAYGITRNMIGRQDHNGPNGKGYTEEGGPMFTLTSTDVHAVAYDEYNDSINETHHALRAGTPQSNGVLADMQVRRLTPLECERLMGWPDDHTLTKADGTHQADSHRYKQCGNGVASNVAQWIGKQIMAIR